MKDRRGDQLTESGPFVLEHAPDEQRHATEEDTQLETPSMDPKDPNFINEGGPDATGYRLLKQDTIVALDKQRRVLQMIVAALMMGILVYGGIVISNGDGPRVFFGAERMDVMLGLAAICFVFSFVVPPFIGRQQRHDNQENPDAHLQDLLNGDPDNDRAIFESQRIQLATIVGCALLEGPAFANLFALSQSNDDVHTLVVLVLLAAMALRFPTRSRYLSRIERVLEEARLEQPLSK